MEEIRLLVKEHYGLKVWECQEQEARIILGTDQGVYYLYSCPAIYRYKRTFIDWLKKHLLKHCKYGLLPIVKTVTGDSYVLVNDELYFLHAGIREVLPPELGFATGQALARFHLATANFSGERLFMPYRSLGGWPGMWRKRLRQYTAYRDDFEQEKGSVTPFDEYLLTTYTYIHHLGDTAIQYLEDSGYHQVVKETASLGKIAYQNFDDGYIMFADDGTCHLAGEWCWVIDMRARDIGQWIKAEIRRSGWDEKRVGPFLDGYNSCSPLICEEYAAIYALLLYPGRYLKLVEAYRRLPGDERQADDFDDWYEQLDEELVTMEEALRLYPRFVAARYGAEIPLIEWLWRSPDEETLCVCDEAD